MFLTSDYDKQKLLRLSEHSRARACGINSKLEEEGDVREVARLASLGLPHAWLEAVPIPALGFYLQPSDFVLDTRYRLGCNVYDRAGPCSAGFCHSDSLGDHAMCCGHHRPTLQMPPWKGHSLKADIVQPECSLNVVAHIILLLQ